MSRTNTENRQAGLEERIGEALDKHAIAAFATVEGNKPKVRYMTVFREGMTLYLPTNRRTHKVEELKANPSVALLLGYDGKAPAEVVEIQGLASISRDDALRTKLWNDDFKQWFNGPDDPDYVVLEISPTHIEYTGADRELQVWEP